jgi:hypothetical protein
LMTADDVPIASFEIVFAIVFNVYKNEEYQRLVYEPFRIAM